MCNYKTCEFLQIKDSKCGSLLVCKRFPFVNENHFFQCNYQAHIDIYKNGSLEACSHYKEIKYNTLADLEINLYVK